MHVVGVLQTVGPESVFIQSSMSGIPKISSEKMRQCTGKCIIVLCGHHMMKGCCEVIFCLIM